MQKKIEFNIFSIQTWSHRTMPAANTLFKEPSSPPWVIASLSTGLLLSLDLAAVLLLFTQQLDFPMKCKSVFVISPKNSLRLPISCSAKTVVLTMAKGFVRLVSSNLFALFLSFCYCSDQTGFLVFLWPREALLWSLSLLFLPPGMFLLYYLHGSFTPESLHKWPLMRENFCDHSL